jgi:hypothetical protein
MDFTIRMLVEINSSKFKTQWSNPTMNVVAQLCSIENLIPRHIRTHFEAILNGTTRYFEMELNRGDVGRTRWTWQ